MMCGIELGCPPSVFSANNNDDSEMGVEIEVASSRRWRLAAGPSHSPEVLGSPAPAINACSISLRSSHL